MATQDPNQLPPIPVQPPVRVSRGTTAVDATPSQGYATADRPLTPPTGGTAPDRPLAPPNAPSPDSRPLAPATGFAAPIAMGVDTPPPTVPQAPAAPAPANPPASPPPTNFPSSLAIQHPDTDSAPAPQAQSAAPPTPSDPSPGVDPYPSYSLPPQPIDTSIQFGQLNSTAAIPFQQNIENQARSSQLNIENQRARAGMEFQVARERNFDQRNALAQQKQQDYETRTASADQTKADRQAATDEKNQWNSAAQEDENNTGKRYQLDPATGRKTPVMENGRQIYNPTSSKEQNDSATGVPYVENRDKYGNVTRVNPGNKDLTDTNIWTQNQNGDWDAIPAEQAIQSGPTPAKLQAAKVLWTQEQQQLATQQNALQEQTKELAKSALTPKMRETLQATVKANSTPIVPLKATPGWLTSGQPTSDDVAANAAQEASRLDRLGAAQKQLDDDNNFQQTKVQLAQTRQQASDSKIRGPAGFLSRYKQGQTSVAGDEKKNPLAVDNAPAPVAATPANPTGNPDVPASPDMDPMQITAAAGQKQREIEAAQADYSAQAKQLQTDATVQNAAFDREETDLRAQQTRGMNGSDLQAFDAKLQDFQQRKAAAAQGIQNRSDSLKQQWDGLKAKSDDLQDFQNTANARLSQPKPVVAPGATPDQGTPSATPSDGYQWGADGSLIKGQVKGPRGKGMVDNVVGQWNQQPDGTKALEVSNPADMAAALDMAGTKPVYLAPPAAPDNSKAIAAAGGRNMASLQAANQKSQSQAAQDFALTRQSAGTQITQDTAAIDSQKQWIQADVAAKDADIKERVFNATITPEQGKAELDAVLQKVGADHGVDQKSQNQKLIQAQNDFQNGKISSKQLNDFYAATGRFSNSGTDQWQSLAAQRRQDAIQDIQQKYLRGEVSGEEVAGVYQKLGQALPQGDWGSYFKNIAHQVVGAVSTATAATSTAAGQASKIVNPVSLIHEGLSAILPTSISKNLPEDASDKLVDFGNQLATAAKLSTATRADPRYVNDYATNAIKGGIEFAPAMMTGGAGAVVMGGVLAGGMGAQDAKDAGLSPLAQTANFALNAAVMGGLQKIVGPIKWAHDGVDTPALLKVLQKGGPTTQDILTSLAKNTARVSAEGTVLNVTGQAGLYAGGDKDANPLDPQAEANSVLGMLPFALLGVKHYTGGIKRLAADINSKVSDINTHLRASGDNEITPQQYMTAMVNAHQGVQATEALTGIQKQFAKIDANTALAPDDALAQKSKLLSAVPEEVRPQVMAHLDAITHGQARVAEMWQQADEAVAKAKTPEEKAAIQNEAMALTTKFQNDISQSADLIHRLATTKDGKAVIQRNNAWNARPGSDYADIKTIYAQSNNAQAINDEIERNQQPFSAATYSMAKKATNDAAVNFDPAKTANDLTRRAQAADPTAAQITPDDVQGATDLVGKPGQTPRAQAITDKQKVWEKMLQSKKATDPTTANTIYDHLTSLERQKTDAHADDMMDAAAAHKEIAQAPPDTAPAARGLVKVGVGKRLGLLTSSELHGAGIAPDGKGGYKALVGPDDLGDPSDPKNKKPIHLGPVQFDEMGYPHVTDEAKGTLAQTMPNTAKLIPSESDSRENAHDKFQAAEAAKAEAAKKAAEKPKEEPKSEEAAPKEEEKPSWTGVGENGTEVKIGHKEAKNETEAREKLAGKLPEGERLTDVTPPPVEPKEGEKPFKKTVRAGQFLRERMAIKIPLKLDPKQKKFAQHVVDVVAPHLDAYSDLFPGGVVFEPAKGGGGLTYFDKKLHIDMNRLAGTIADHERVGGDVDAVIQSMMREEVIHRAATEVIKPQEVADLWSMLPSSIQQTVRETYYANEVQNGQPLPEESDNAYNMGHEFLRMLAQDKVFGQITETNHLNMSLIAKLRDILSKLGQRLQAMLKDKTITNEETRIAVQTNLDKITDHLQKLGVVEAKIAAEPPPPAAEPPTTPVQEKAIPPPEEDHDTSDHLSDQSATDLWNSLDARQKKAMASMGGLEGYTDAQMGRSYVAAMHYFKLDGHDYEYEEMMSPAYRAIMEPDFVPKESFAPMTDAEIKAQDKARKEDASSAKNSTETLIQAVRKVGGLTPSDPTLQGELKNIKEAANKGTMLTLVRKDGKTLDQLREALEERGFKFDTITDMLSVIDRSLSSKKDVFPAGNSSLRAGESVKSDHALKVYNRLFTLQRSGAKLNPGQARLLETAERQLGQKMMFDEQEEQRKLPNFDYREMVQPALLSGRTPQTESHEFKKWFEDSKVVDDNGKPLVVYHATTKDFHEFERSKLGERTNHPASLIGFFFTKNPDVADYFLKGRNGYGDGDNIKPFYVSIKNPYTISNKDFQNLLSTIPEDIELAKSWWIKNTNDMRRAGYDGVYIPRSQTKTEWKELSSDIWVALDATQIKSSIGNRGTFDGTSNNTLQSGRTPSTRDQLNLFDTLTPEQKGEVQAKGLDLFGSPLTEKRSNRTLKGTHERKSQTAGSRSDDDLFGGNASPAASTPVEKPAGDGQLSLGELSGKAGAASGTGQQGVSGSSRGDRGNRQPSGGEDLFAPAKLPQGMAGDQGGGKPSDRGRNGGLPAKVPRTRPGDAVRARPVVGSPERNHEIAQDDTLAPRGDVGKLNANFTALRLLKTLDSEGRNATPDEKRQLAQYVGWGGLSQAFDDQKAYESRDSAIKDKRLLGARYANYGPSYAKESENYFEQAKALENWREKWGKWHDQLKAELTPEEYAAAKESTINAHYTSPDVIRAMWRQVQHMGFKGGKILEPAGGVGHFFGLMPESIANRSQLDAVELDKVSGRILKKLYPEADVQVAGFQDAKIPDNSVDLAISNVPFAKTGPYDKVFDAAKAPKFNLHNYFFAKAMQKVKPGGLVAFITTAHTMDSAIEQRKWLADRGELVGAVRLPNTAFNENAKTDVTTDIVYIRKPGGETATPRENFSGLSDVKTHDGKPIKVNEYFARHPENILGKLADDGSMYGTREKGEMTVHPHDNAGPIGESIDKTTASLPKDILSPAADRTPDQQSAEDILKKTRDAKVGSIQDVGDGKLAIAGTPDQDEDILKPQNRQLAKNFIGLRDALNEQYRMELDPASKPSDIEANRAKLNAAYDQFRRDHGAVHGHSDLLGVDPDYYRLLGAEDEKKPDAKAGQDGNAMASRKKVFEKGAVFRHSVLTPRSEPTHADTVADAMGTSLGWRGRMDTAFMSKLTDRSQEEVEKELLDKGLAYRNPETGTLETRDAYLSGNVRKKLAVAEEAAKSDPAYKSNVEELQKVQPPDIPLKDIKMRLGSTWIPTDSIQDFAREVMGSNGVEVIFHPGIGDTVNNEYEVRYSGMGSRQMTSLTPQMRSTFGTDRISGIGLLEKTLNLKQPKIYDKMDDGSMVFNPTATTQAEQAMQKIKDAFEKWVGDNPAHGDVLAKTYNEVNNSHVLRKYDGQFMQFPWLAKGFDLYPDKKDVVWRAIQDGRMLIAHGVGAGKTNIGTAIAMEMKRLGLAKKPLIVAHNATLEQFAATINAMSPTARVLVARKADLEGSKRKEFMAKVAAGDWDAVIMAHSSFDMVPDDPAWQRRQIEELLEQLDDALRSKGASAGDDLKKVKDPTVKELINRRNALSEKIQKLQYRKVDDVLSFQQLGVDMMIMDEAHEYKKMPFVTQLDNIAGIDKGASEKGTSLLSKSRWIQAQNKGKNVFTMTGTPITNTLGESWNMMRLVAPDLMKEFNATSFDNFVSTFADVKNSAELRANGSYKSVNRLAEMTNLPEWNKFFRLAADVKLGEDMVVKGRPAIKGGGAELHALELTPQVGKFMAYIKTVIDDYDRMSGKEKRENSCLPLLTYNAAKQAAIDIRLVDPQAADEPGSKVNVALKNILDLYKRTNDYRGTQVVFSDTFRPMKSTKLNMTDAELEAEESTGPKLTDEQEEVQAEKMGGFNLYSDIKRKLVAGGVPEKEIAIISDFKTDGKKAQLYQDVNDGKIRIVIGSRKKLGTGVNMQQRMIAAHHLDVPWTPAELEQSDGRVYRQGNIHSEMGVPIELPRYGMKDTLDAALWQKIETKTKFTKQVLSGKINSRSIEDDAGLLSLAEQKAVLSGPLGVKKFNADTKVRQLENEARAHQATIFDSKQQAYRLQRDQAYYADNKAELQKHQANIAGWSEKPFSASVDGATFNDQKEASEAVKAMFEARVKLAGEVKNPDTSPAVNAPLGEITYKGSAIQLGKPKLSERIGELDPTKKFSMTVPLLMDGREIGEATSGNTTFNRLEEHPEAVAHKLEGYDRSIARIGKELDAVNEVANEKFPKQAALDKAYADQAEVMAEYAKKNEKPPVIHENEPLNAGRSVSDRDRGQGTFDLGLYRNPGEFNFGSSLGRRLGSEQKVTDGRSHARLVTENLGLATTIAKKFQAPGVDVDDLIQEARIGLLKAAQAFQPEQGTKFSSFASAIINNRLRDLYKSRISRSAHEGGSLDEEVGEDGDTRQSLTPDAAPSEPLPVERSETAKITEEEVAKLPARPQAIVRAFMAGKSGEEIAANMGVTRQAVNQSLKGALMVLKKALERRGLKGQEEGVLYSGETPKINQTETPEFKRWFGGSKLVDGQGRPIRLYHGTRRPGFTTFDPNMIGGGTDPGLFGEGYYFTDSPKTSDIFSEDGGTYPIYGKMEKPFDWDDDESSEYSKVTRAINEEMGDKTSFYAHAAAVTKVLREMGYDGGISTTDNGSREYVFFDNKQIKSAIGNRGTFDPENPSILHAGETPNPSDYDDLAHLFDNLNDDVPSYDEINAMRDRAGAEESGKQTIGNPDKANYGKSREERREIDVVHQLREDNFKKQQESDWIDEARERLAADENGVKKMILKTALSGKGFDEPWQVKAAQMLVPRLMREAIASGDATKRREAFKLAWAYDAGGSDQARAFAARRDPFKTPAERHMEFLTKMISTPDAVTRAEIKAEPNPTKRNAMLTAAQDERYDKIVKALGDLGLTPDDVFSPDKLVYLKSTVLVQRAVMNMGDEKLQKAGRMILDRYSSGQIAKELGISRGEAEKLQAKFDANLDAEYGKYLDQGMSVDRILQNLKDSDLSKLFSGETPGTGKVSYTPEERAAALKTLREATRGNLDDVNAGKMQKRLKRRVDPLLPVKGSLSNVPIPPYENLKQDSIRPNMTPDELAEYNRTRRPDGSPADSQSRKQDQIRPDMTPEELAEYNRIRRPGNEPVPNDNRMQNGMKFGDEPKPSDNPIPGYEPLKQDQMKPGLTPEEQAEFNRTRRPTTDPVDAARYKAAQDMYDKEIKFENVPFDPASVEQNFRLARQIQAIDLNKFDMVYEAWINSILSGPQTHAMLSAGMGLNAAWNFTMQRGMEAAINAAFVHDPQAAQFGEFKHIARGVVDVKGAGEAIKNRLSNRESGDTAKDDLKRIASAAFPAISKALKFAAKVYGSEEHYAFEREALNSQMEFKGYDKTGGINAAIPGTTGRVIRIPSRIVMAQDSFFKAVIGQLEATAQAYRIGKAMGRTGDDLSTFMRSQVNLPGSMSWQRAVKMAEEGTFQTQLRSWSKGGGPAEGIAKLIQDARHADTPNTALGQVGQKMLGFVFPFIRTPYNIYRSGLAKTPLGAGAVGMRIGSGLYRMYKGKPMFNGDYEKAAFVKDLATQTIAWASAALLYGSIEGDKDDDNKPLLITGSRPHGIAKQGEVDLANRTVGGPYQIRIGGRHGQYFNYGRIEPFATVLGTVADAMRIAKQGQDPAASIAKFGGYFKAQAEEKTFLQGISSISQAMDNMNSSDPGAATKGIVRQFLTGLVPNIIRQPLRNLDDFERDNRNASPLYGMTAIGGLANKKTDVYGGESEKAGNPLSRIVARSGDIPNSTVKLGDKFLVNWNRENPDKPFYPTAPTDHKYKDASGQKVDMTADQISAYDKAVGKRFAEGMDSWLTPDMAANPTEDTKKMFESEHSKATREVKEEMFGGGVPAPTPRRGSDISSIFGWK